MASQEWSSPAGILIKRALSLEHSRFEPSSTVPCPLWTSIIEPWPKRTMETDRERSMRTRHLLSILTLGSAVIFFQALPAAAESKAGAALTGQVTSAAEGAMEGVVVSAKKEGSTVTVSVISDAQGRYSFPADRLSAGKYRIKIRAIGYDLAAPATADVADAQTATQDLKLQKAKNLVPQMSNAEWMASIPGSD